MGQALWFKKRSGHMRFTGYMPEWHDPDEPAAEIEFDWGLPEPQTRDYPGSPGYVRITAVRPVAGGRRIRRRWRPCSAPEIDVDTMAPELLDELTQQAKEWLDAFFVPKGR